MNKNKVELIGWYGGDEAIVCSAWTSTNRDLTPEKRERIPKLINDLWNAEPVSHGSPFEKGIVHFLVDTDIASHIHFLKHRISSLNAESARYKELNDLIKENIF
jgi:thymidylate synthase ThyX